MQQREPIVAVTGGIVESFVFQIFFVQVGLSLCDKTKYDTLITYICLL